MLNRGGDFKARRGCGIIWMGSCNNKQRFSSSPSSSRRDGAAKGKPGCTKMPCMAFSPQWACTAGEWGCLLQSTTAFSSRILLSTFPAELRCRRNRVPGWISLSHSLFPQPHASGSISFKVRTCPSEKVHGVEREAGTSHQEREWLKRIGVTLGFCCACG